MEEIYDWQTKFKTGEYIGKWRGLDSVWVDMSWFNRNDLTLKKYINCVGTFCGIGQVDWWVTNELEKLSDEEKDELFELCQKNRKNILFQEIN